ncbi:unnamed protein product [Phaeothamnion confervicola]
MEYGAQGGGYFGGGGGGFIQGANGSPGYPDGSPAGGGGGGGGAGGRVNKEKQTIIPLTIRMIVNAKQDQPDGKFMVDNCELQQVKIVGFIRDVVAMSTNSSYIVEDGTGLLDCRMFHDSDESEQEVERRDALVQHTFVRVYGSVRFFDGKASDAYGTMHMTVNNIRPIEDTNELTYHALEVIYVHLLHTRGPLNAPAGGAAAGGGFAVGGGGFGMGGGGGFRQPQFGGSPQQQSFNGGGMGMGIGGGGDGMMAFTAKQQMVVECFTGGGGETGISIQTAVQQLGPRGVTAAEVREIVGQLAGEGHLYSTTDEEHFKSTNG